MLVDKESQIHLYVQIAGSLRQRIASGEFPSGSALPTEEELCALYGVSRYPMRQAMGMLVREGVLSRTRGKGTFVNDPAAAPPQPAGPCADRPTLALLLAGIGEFTADILAGFERAASEGGYTTMLALSGGAGRERACIDRLVQSGAKGIVIFSVDETTIDEALLDDLAGRGIYVSVIDRNPGLDHIDYVGSDNSGGGYLAARHMKAQGWETAVFVAHTRNVSTVQERFSGFQKGARQFGIRLLNDEEDQTISPDVLKEKLDQYRRHVPFGIFAVNDEIAARVLSILRDEGLKAGEDVGLIGFDNMTLDEHLSPPLTSVAQNGMLIGEAAAALAVQKLETGSRQSVRHILPTQLIVRRSCGEGRAKRSRDN